MKIKKNWMVKFMYREDWDRWWLNALPRAECKDKRTWATGQQPSAFKDSLKFHRGGWEPASYETLFTVPSEFFT